MTLVATLQEIISIYNTGKVDPVDPIVVVYHTEVLGMIGVFYASNKIPTTLSLFIAMTALARLIIHKEKKWIPITLVYEAGAIAHYCFGLFNY